MARRSAPPRVLDASSTTVRWTKAEAAAWISQHYIPVSPRTLERWPISWRTVGGRSTAKPADVKRAVESRIRDAAAVAGGRASTVKRETKGTVMT